MSVENFPGRYPDMAETLSLREQIFIKTANIIDQRAEHDGNVFTDHGAYKVLKATWSDVCSGKRFELSASGERLSPEERMFMYRLIGRNPDDLSTICDFSYDTHSMKVSKTNARGNYHGCRKEDMSALLQHLATAPVDLLSDEENQEFVALMHENKIADSRFHVQIKRQLASWAIGMFGNR